MKKIIKEIGFLSFFLFIGYNISTIEAMLLPAVNFTHFNGIAGAILMLKRVRQSKQRSIPITKSLFKRMGNDLNDIFDDVDDAITLSIRLWWRSVHEFNEILNR